MDTEKLQIEQRSEIINGDCLEVMAKLPYASIDMILCDLPYGTTANKWDTIIPLEALWKQYLRIIKENGAIILTASQSFTTTLIASNMHDFKYCWVWEKSRFSNQMMAKKQPLRITEDVCVFSRGKVSYNPQALVEVNQITKQGSRISDNVGGGIRKTEYVQTHTNYPRNILRVPSEGNTQHPTQKPVALFEYLIKTYTNPGDLVLDNCCGSGTTGVACKNTGRSCIQIEKDPTYCDIAKRRLQEQPLELKQAA